VEGEVVPLAFEGSPEAAGGPQRIVADQPRYRREDAGSVQPGGRTMATGLPPALVQVHAIPSTTGTTLGNGAVEGGSLADAERARRLPSARRLTIPRQVPQGLAPPGRMGSSIATSPSNITLRPGETQRSPTSEWPSRCRVQRLGYTGRASFSAPGTCPRSGETGTGDRSRATSTPGDRAIRDADREAPRQGGQAPPSRGPARSPRGGPPRTWRDDAGGSQKGCRTFTS